MITSAIRWILGVGAGTLAALLFLLAPLAAPAGAKAAASMHATPAPAALSPFGIEHAIALRGFGDLAWSPDGRRLAFVIADPDTVESTTNYDIYLADFTDHEVRRLTRNPRGDGSPSFSPGGDTLAFVGTRPGDTRPAIYMMSLKGGEPWSFGSYDEAIGEVKWSPDGRWLAFTKNDTTPKRVAELRRGRRDGVVEDERLQYAHLWLIDTATGEQRRLVGGAHQVWYLRWSPDSKSVAFLVSPSGNVDDANLSDIGVVPVSGGPIRTLNTMAAAFEWSPDSRWIAWAAGRNRETYVEKDELWVCDRSGGEARSLSQALDENASTPAWSTHSDSLFFFVAQGVTTLLASVALRGGPVHLLTDHRGVASQLTTGSGGHAAWIESHPDAADELYWAPHAALTGTRFSELNAAATHTVLGTTRVVSWTSSDGIRCEGVLLRPAGAAPHSALKTLVYLHGGPYGFRSDLGFAAQQQALASAGYQVFMPNYRASGGYGSAFMIRQRGDWGGQDWRDITSGIDSLVHDGLADPARLGIVGGSYGGYLSAWAITQTQRFKAAVMVRGICDLPALWGQSDSQRYRSWDFGGRPWEAFDRMRERSPIAHISQAHTPMLIIVGDNDARTPLPQSRELYESLKSLGIPVEFVHYPREGHGLREPRHRSDELQRTQAWFDRWLR